MLLWVDLVSVVKVERSEIWISADTVFIKFLCKNPFRNLASKTQENAKYSAAGAVSDFLVKVHMVRCTALGFTERLFEIFDQKCEKIDDEIMKY